MNTGDSGAGIWFWLSWRAGDAVASPASLQFDCRLAAQVLLSRGPGEDRKRTGLSRGESWR
jgi:hypothetical protein